MKNARFAWLLLAITGGTFWLTAQQNPFLPPVLLARHKTRRGAADGEVAVAGAEAAPGGQESSAGMGRHAQWHGPA